ncbi:MAG: hypothetical protein R3354_03855, partial [Thiohalomonadales bacterium]|nr:hypothetical protein [Thiohalomonadales bacterium]
IPTEAILEGNRVLRLEENGILHEQHIKTGLSNWEFTEVLDGLKENDRIVVSVDRDGVKDGAHAEPETNNSR